VQKDKKTPKKQAKGYSDYSKFLGLVFQMFAIILAGALLGQFLDKQLLSDNSQPWLTICLSMISLFIALYLMIKKSEE
jgi:F0F1-type ATP synthase assembly protein I